MRICSILPALALATVASSAFASPITYSFSNTVGSSTASGTITTDGNLGTLALGDITSFTLTLTNGSTTETSGATAFVRLIGDALSASSTALSFNYSDTTASYFVLFTNNQLSGNLYSNFYCLVDAGASCAGSDRSDAFANVNNVPTSVLESGTQQFASSLAPTPEPSSLALFGTGALGMVAAVRRRFRRA